MFVSSTINVFLFYLEGGLENSQEKKTETREKGFCKTSFQLRMDQNKGQKQGRDEEHKKTTLYAL